MEEELTRYLEDFTTERRQELFREILDNRTRHVTVVLEDLYQTHNASAVLRSCDCFGIQDVHIIEKTNTFEVTKGISLGSGKWLTLNQHNNTSNNTISCLKHLKNKGYRIVATTPHEDDCLIQDLDYTEPTALVFGKEMEGISEDVREMADAYVKIPMYGFTESFNISVAAALCLYETRKQLKSQKIDWQLSQAEKNELYLKWLEKSIKSSDRIIEQWHERNK